MFAIVAIFCLFASFVSLVVVPAERQKRAVSVLRAVGGMIYYDYEKLTLSDGSSEWIPEAEVSPPGPPWLRDLIGVDYFTNVVEVGFIDLSNPQSEPPIRDDHLRRLQHFRKLETLTLYSCPDITDDGLEHLKPLKNLKSLHLYGTKATTNGIADLQQALPNCKIESDF